MCSKAQYMATACSPVMYQTTMVVKVSLMVGPTWTRVHFTLGLDCFPSLFQGTALLCFPTLCLSHWSLMHVRCQMIQGCISTSPLLFLFCVLYAPLRAVFLNYLYVHLHGSLYPMMDYMSHVYDGLHSSCLLMLHEIQYDTITSSYGTWFTVL